VKKLLLVAVLTLFATSAFARPKMDGRSARKPVKSYYKAKGWSSKIRVHKVRYSQSRKSSQVAVTTLNSGKVRLFNVHRKSGKVSRTRTGLITQRTARGKANLRLRRENKPYKGTFSGVNNSGLSKKGKSYRFNSATDKNERAYVHIKTGGLRRYDR
jgi:hypothetical protein